ncbi:hypothetical protein EAE99_007512 [Botrytis elliptica]|nr:hypothetical protein EAE99_007512 [Botrytis elliptica]
MQFLRVFRRYALQMVMLRMSISRVGRDCCLSISIYTCEIWFQVGMVHIALLPVLLRWPHSSLVMMNVQFKIFKRLMGIRARRISSMTIGWFLWEIGGQLNLRMEGNNYSSVERLLRVQL